MADEKRGQYAFDSLFFRRFRLCLKISLSSVFSDSSLQFILLLGLCLGQQLVIYSVGLLPSNFMQVLGNKDKPGMKSLLVKAFCLICTIALCKSAINAVSGYIYLHWRKRLTLYIHRKYMSNSMHYQITAGLIPPYNIDNPDQRIAQDIDRFCLQISDISAQIVISPLIIIYYSIQCFSVGGVTGPLIIYAYFIIGTLINKFIMSFIVNLVYTQEKREGNFRFKHVQIRNFSESIAFIGSENHEFFKLNMFLKQLLQVQQKIVNSEIFLNISTNTIDYIGSILSYIIVSIPIFLGKYDNLSSVDLSVLISKNAFVSMYLINCFSTLIDQSSKLTEISGYTHRIGELIEALSIDIINEQKELYRNFDSNDDVLCRITNLTYKQPTSEKPLLTNLNLDIIADKNLLITGNIGSGKSSLLRVLKKLWKPDSGNFQFYTQLHSNCENCENVMFLPQNPILTNGSLFDQVIYPLLKKDLKNYPQTLDSVLKVLEDVGLLSLLTRVDDIDCDPCWNWSKKLSPGEIQSISFARLFFHQPKLAFLDEATSALGLSEEDCFYKYCQMLGITVVSIGHRDSLKQYHKSCLKIKGDGTWELYDIDH